MNKYFVNAVVPALLLCGMLFSCIACSKDNDEPVVESVWINMTAIPTQQVTYAYPGQTLCLRGSGLGDLRKLNVNGTNIEITNTLIYNTDNSVLFKLPTDINTTGDYIKVTTRYGQTTYSPFVVRATSLQPKITKFSATTLLAGRVLTITGTNLNGATEVWLPMPFDQKVKCELDATQEQTDKNIYVIIPADVTFAKGQCEIVMEKTDAERGISYTEKVYSSVTNFTN